RTKEKTSEVVSQGAVWCENVSEVARRAEIVFSMVGFPKDVEDIYFGASGIIENARRNTILVDMTTSSPLLAKEIASAALDYELIALDAPVSGGDIGAKTGNLAIMVGGNKEAFLKIKPIIKVMGENVVLQGPSGSGQHTKMVNQIAIASNMIGVSEAIAYVEKVGLDPRSVLESIGSGAAGSWSLSNLAPRMIEGDFSPGFYVKHFIKDMKIAIESADEMGLKMPGLRQAKKMYDYLAVQGYEDYGTQSLYYWYR